MNIRRTLTPLIATKNAYVKHVWHPEYATMPATPPMTTARVLWLIWCLGWAGFWFILGWFLPGLNIIMGIISITLCLIPIGK